MFAVMNLNDIPAVYLTAQVALLSVMFLYLTVVLCFSMWCYVDMCRQAQGRNDLLCCGQSPIQDREKPKMWADIFYDGFYKPLMLKNKSVAFFASHLVIWATTITLIALGVWGLSDENREVGLGLEVCKGIPCAAM